MLVLGSIRLLQMDSPLPLANFRVCRTTFITPDVTDTVVNCNACVLRRLIAILIYLLDRTAKQSLNITTPRQ